MKRKLILSLVFGIACAELPQDNTIKYENYFEVVPVGSNLTDDFKIMYNKLKVEIENFVNSPNFEEILKKKTDDILLNHSEWLHNNNEVQEGYTAWKFPETQTWNAAVIFKAIIEKQYEKILDTPSLSKYLEKTKYIPQKSE